MRTFQSLGLFVLAVLVSAHAHAAPPNIILVITDDQGYGDWACTGNPSVKTPHIDALAAQSVRLTNFHVSPTCAPTRCSLMTGRHEFRSGVTHTIHERERMALFGHDLSSAVAEDRYKTGSSASGTWGTRLPYQPEKRGFDEVFIHGAAESARAIRQLW